jgi:uncharacterized protein
MNWMLTAHGRPFNLGSPRADEIWLEDIAHQLAMINRFNGATTRPYSVAEHCILVSQILETELGVTDPHAQLAALMHDAHEIYFGDVISPVKHYMGEGAQVLEWSLMAKVQERYGLKTANRAHHDEIRRADLIALATERRDLMHPLAPPFPVLAGIDPVGWADLTSPSRATQTWQQWRAAFTARFTELNTRRAQLIGANEAIPE